MLRSKFTTAPGMSWARSIGVSGLRLQPGSAFSDFTRLNPKRGMRRSESRGSGDWKHSRRSDAIEGRGELQPRHRIATVNGSPLGACCQSLHGSVPDFEFKQIMDA